MDRGFAAEDGLRPIVGIVMEERPASSQFIGKGLDSYSLPRVFIVFSPDAQGNSVPGWHDDTGWPDLDIELIHFSGCQGLFHVVRVIGTVFGADGRIEFTMGCPEPPLCNGGMGVESTLENDLFEVGSEDP
jgi:hypothetical protein